MAGPDTGLQRTHTHGSETRLPGSGWETGGGAYNESASTPIKAVLLH